MIEAFPPRVDYLFTLGSLTTGGVRGALACHQGHSEPPGSLCTFRNCSPGLAQDCHASPVLKNRLTKVSLNSSRPLRALPRAGTYIDESPALTAVLQARPGAIVQANVKWHLLVK